LRVEPQDSLVKRFPQSPRFPRSQHRECLSAMLSVDCGAGATPGCAHLKHLV
jgi:hypothetical protein